MDSQPGCVVNYSDSVPSASLFFEDLEEELKKCPTSPILTASSCSTTAIRLTKERLQFAAESRLRSARLFKADDGLPFLTVSVDVVGEAFSTGLGYNKRLFDPASGSGGIAATWSIRMSGTYGPDRRRVHRFKAVGAPRPIPGGVPAGERISLHGKPAAADPVERWPSRSLPWVSPGVGLISTSISPTLASER